MSQKTTARLELPPKLVPLFSPKRGELRYRGAYGGRGSAKSQTFAKMASVWGYAEPLRILCVRDILKSIKESFYAEVKKSIASEPWLSDAYTVGENYIKGKNGTEFLFEGLRGSLSNIPSLSDIDLCIIEEAEAVHEQSYMVLEPTIRNPKSEIWVIWNPKKKGSPTDFRFRQHTPPRSMFVEMNWRDNPWFPKELEEQRNHAKTIMDTSTYMHIWEGHYLERSDAQVFRNWRIEEFEAPKDALFRFGADWGFSVDPTVLVRCYIIGRKLYIDYEAYQVNCEIMDTPDLFMTVPESEKWPITADSARPETISHLQKHGFPKILPALKGPKSLEDGIEWLKTFEIVVHPRCEKTIMELSNYSYKIDDLTGQVLPVLEDKDNHVIDALRYACEGARRAQKPNTKPLNYKNRYVV